MNRAEIQYALDRRGYVKITENALLDGPLQVGHLTGKVVIETKGGYTLGNSSTSGRHAIEYNYLDSYTHDPCEIYIDGVEFDNNATYSGFFKVIQPGTAPSRLHITASLISGSGNYAIDCPSSGDMECLVFQDVQFNGSGCVRWLFDDNASNDFVHMNANRVQGNARIGPGYYFQNAQNVTMRLNINEQSPALFSDLFGVYEGPIAVRIDNPKGRCIIDDFWFEPWGTWDNLAPNCYGFECRTDDVSGNYGQRVLVTKNTAFAASGLSTGVALNSLQGGHSSSNACSLLVFYEDYWKPSDVEFDFGGKIRVIFDRPFDNSDMDDAIEATVDGIIANSWRDPIRVPSFGLPFNEFSANEDGGRGYTTPLTTNWVDQVAEYDEGLI